jgi:hypothetical protein
MRVMTLNDMIRQLADRRGLPIAVVEFRPACKCAGESRDDFVENKLAIAASVLEGFAAATAIIDSQILENRNRIRILPDYIANFLCGDNRRLLYLCL